MIGVYGERREKKGGVRGKSLYLILNVMGRSGGWF